MARRLNAAAVRAIAARHLASTPGSPFTLGLPEYDNRRGVWRVVASSGTATSEVVVSDSTGRINFRLSRLGEAASNSDSVSGRVRLGDFAEVARSLASESVGLAFTSPPYYNARPEYAEYPDYPGYLAKMGECFRQVHRLLRIGRFLVVNCSPVLVRRAKRSESSRRIAIPFDFHALLVAAGFEFVDDIVWVKPEGAGWATGRGRRFAADRSPLQYKAVPVTESVLVYRKPGGLIDGDIRAQDQAVRAASRIGDDYERTNVWRISPRSKKGHPAVFPDELAQRVIRYYSFVGDTVLDPFAGSGTVGRVAASLGRDYLLCDCNESYVKQMREEEGQWSAAQVK